MKEISIKTNNYVELINNNKDIHNSTINENLDDIVIEKKKHKTKSFI